MMKVAGIIFTSIGGVCALGTIALAMVTMEMFPNRNDGNEAYGWYTGSLAFTGIASLLTLILLGTGIGLLRRSKAIRLKKAKK